MRSTSASIQNFHFLFYQLHMLFLFGTIPLTLPLISTNLEQNLLFFHVHVECENFDL